MKSPFKFLDAYDREDREIFFGRDREIEELYQKVFGGRILLLYGISGTGKTSLINCGLANKFEESDWLPVNIRRGKDINESLEAEIRKVSITPVKKGASVVNIIQSVYLDHFKPVNLIFDQFEELFIFGDRQERKEFIETIHDIIESDLQCKCLFSIREEYLAGVTEFEQVIDDFLDNRIRIEKMTRAHAVKVIEGPCKVAGIEVDEGLTGTILEKLSPESTEVELTYLQVLLDKMFRLAVEQKKGKPSFTGGLLQQVGDVTDLLGTFLEEQVSQLEDPETGLVVLKSFVSVRGTKKQVTDAEISYFAQTLGKEISEGELKNLVQKFIALRILRDKDSGGRYELRHDSLAAKIYEKITLVEKEMMEVRAFLENAFNNYEKREKVLGPDDLEYIAPYENKLFLPPRVSGFIELSKREAQKAARRRRQWISVSSAALIMVLGGLTIWAVSGKKRSDLNLAKSTAANLNFQAAELTVTDPGSALRLAEYAHELDPDNNEIWKNIKRIYYSNNLFKTIGKCDSPIQSMEISPNGKMLVAVTWSGKCYLYDISGGLLRTFKGHSNHVKSVCFTPDGEFILTGSQDRSVRLWDLEGNMILEYGEQSSPVWDAAISPDGKRVLAGYDDGRAILWNRDGSLVREFTGFEEIVIDVDFSLDGTKMLFATARGNILICDADGTPLHQFVAHSSWMPSARFSPDGMQVLTTSSDGHSVLWDLEGNSIADFSANWSTKESGNFSPGGELVVTCSRDHLARIWDTRGNYYDAFRGHTSWVISALFTPDSRFLVTASYDGTIKKWNLGTLPMKEFYLPTRTGYKGSMISHESDLILTAGMGENIARLWDMNGKLMTTFRGHGDRVSALCFAPGDSIVLTGSRDGSIITWDLYGNITRNLKWHRAEVSSIDFLPGGGAIGSTSLDSAACEWNTSSGELRSNRFNLPVTNLKYSPDGGKVLVGGHFSELYFVDRSNGFEFELEGHTSGNTCLAFSDDGQWMASGSNDNTVRLWDRGGKLRAVCRGHTGMITSVDFSGDGKWLISTAIGDQVRLWDMEGNELIRLPVYDNNTEFRASLPVYNIEDLQNTHYAVFIPGTDSIFTITEGGTVRIWAMKMPYEVFRDRGEYDQLSVRREVEYGIRPFRDLLSSDDTDALLEVADFYLDSSRLFTEEEKYDSYRKASQLLHKANKAGSSVDHLLQEIDALVRLYMIREDRRIPGETDRLFRRMLKTDEPGSLQGAVGFFFHPVYDTRWGGPEIPDELGYADKTIQLIREIMNRGESGDQRRYISNLSDMVSDYYIMMKQYRQAIATSQFSFRVDSTFYHAKINLIKGYLLNDQFDSAVSELDVWKDSMIVFSEDRVVPFKKRLLDEMDWLLEDSIYHPNFEKVRALLNE
jgi:WD40 repeat protein